MFNARIGIDVGNGYVKYRGKAFKTRVKTGKLLKVGNKREDIHTAKMNGLDFIVGDGEMITGEDKYDNIRFKLCVLTAIADANKRFKNLKVRLCLGMPLLDKERLEDEVVQKILSWGEQSLVVDDREVTIEIVDVDIFIEGALPILTEDTGHILTLDIGSGTLNAIEWEGMTPINFDTIKGSFYKMYSDMATYLNNTKGGNFTVADIEKLILQGKKETIIKQVMTDVSEIYMIMDDFVSGSASLLKQKFNTEQVEKIQLLGGGATPSFDYWVKHFSHAHVELVPNSQFINSEIYEMVANM